MTARVGGRYVTRTSVLGSYDAWVPPTLPDPFRMSDPTLERFERIDRLWRALADTMSSCHLILTCAEVAGSSLIENIEPPQSDWDTTWAAHLAGMRIPPAGVRYSDAVFMLDLYRTYTSPSDTPVTELSGRDDHRVLLQMARSKSPGDYRDGQVWIGGPYPQMASYVPPPAEYVPDLMADLYRWIGQHLHSTRHPVSLIAAVAHAQFESIHPYTDGNGRAGRLLIHRMRAARGTTAVLPFSLATWLDRQGYYSALNDWRGKDGMYRWLRWYAATANSAISWARQICETASVIVEHIETACAVRRGNRVIDAIVGQLRNQPIFTAQSMAEATGFTPDTVHARARELSTIHLPGLVDMVGNPVRVKALDILPRPKARRIYVCRPLWYLCSPARFRGGTQVPPVRWQSTQTNNSDI